MTGLHVEDLWVPLRRRLSRIRQENRDLDAFLRGLDYVPKLREKATGPRDFIICGSPRSGTTLAAAQLFQPPAVITAIEPWDGLRLPPHQLFERVRDDLAGGTLRHGRLDIDVLRRHGRVSWLEEEVEVDVGTVADDVLVGVKWPSWWQYLDALPATKFIVCLRHPHDVIGSYERTGGRLREGADHPVAMNRDVNRRVRAGSRSLAVRRALLYETINRRLLDYLRRPNVLALRFERWHSDPEVLRAELSSFLDTSLGPWPATIRSPDYGPVSPRAAKLIRRHAPVAGELGYDT